MVEHRNNVAPENTVDYQNYDQKNYITNNWMQKHTKM